MHVYAKPVEGTIEGIDAAQVCPLHPLGVPCYETPFGGRLEIALAEFLLVLSSRRTYRSAGRFVVKIVLEGILN